MLIACIIPAAGLSSRMGEFKPLMDVNGFPLIEMTVQSALEGGATHISVVTGNRSDDIVSALSMLEVSCPFNSEYETSDMLSSIRIGLRDLMGRCEEGLAGFFLLPADMPCIDPKTFALISNYAIENDIDMLKPSHNGKNAHPPFISSKCFDAILAYEGDRGLKGALEGFEVVGFPIEDEGSLLDADTPEDIEAIRSYARSHKGISFERCVELLDLAQTPGNVRAHTEAVSKLARRIATNLNAAGYHLDVELCASAAMLHDIMRVHPQHSKAGAKLLYEHGYDAIARIVLEHDGFFGLYPTDFDESIVVCLADKYLQDDNIVTVRQRYDKGIRLWGHIPKVSDRINFDVEILEHIQRRYEELTDDRFV